MPGRSAHRKNGQLANDGLGDWYVEPHAPLEVGAESLHQQVGRDSHDGEPGPVRVGRPLPEPAPDRIDAGKEPAPEALVDHRDRLLAGPVGLDELAAARDGRLERLEVPGHDAASAHERDGVAAAIGPSPDLDRDGGAVTGWQTVGNRGRLHAGVRPQPRQELLDQARAAGSIRILRAGQVDPGGEHPVHRERQPRRSSPARRSSPSDRRQSGGRTTRSSRR